MKAILTLIFCLLPTLSSAKVIKETTEVINIEINKENLNCEMERVAAHAGHIIIPTSYLTLESPIVFEFEHKFFRGSLDLPEFENCEATDDLINSNQKPIEVRVHTTLSTLTFRDVKDGPIKSIETIEHVRIYFLDGSERYMYSTQSQREVF